MIYTEDSIPSKFTAYLTKVGDHQFLDIVPVRPECGNDFYKGFLISAHSFYKVSLENESLRLEGLNVDWLRDKYRADEIALVLTIIRGDDFVLTASTTELREFVLKYSENEDAFPKGEKAFRQK